MKRGLSVSMETRLRVLELEDTLGSASNERAPVISCLTMVRVCHSLSHHGLWLEFQECGTCSVIKDESNLEMTMIRGGGNINIQIGKRRIERDGERD